MSSKNELLLKHLSPSTIKQLSTLLNSRKVIPTQHYKLRDWRGVCESAGFGSDYIDFTSRNENPLGKCLQDWIYKDSNVTVHALTTTLEELDRYDVIQDCDQKICEDHKQYLLDLSAVPASSNITNTKCLTIDDEHCINSGISQKTYDALLLYDDSDREFADTVTDKLENSYNLSLCIKDRDLLIGTNELTSMMELIDNRCSKVLIIISSELMKSNLNSFLTNFTQGVNIYQKERKLIPLIYKKLPDCEFPMSLRFYHCWDYTRKNVSWEHLLRSITGSTVPPKLKCEDRVKAGAESKVVCESEEFELNLPQLSSSSLDSLDSGISSTSLLITKPTPQKLPLVTRIKKKIMQAVQ